MDSLTLEQIDTIEAGRELDELVSRSIPIDGVKIENETWGAKGPMWKYNGGFRCEFSPSTDIAAAWEVVNKLAPLVSNFQGGDGFFELMRSEWASHQVHNCKADEGRVDDAKWDDDGPDNFVWSAHFHLNDMVEGPQYPESWKHFDRFCARANTAPLAICRAALKAVSSV